jgi:hypothetical protein
MKVVNLPHKDGGLDLAEFPPGDTRRVRGVAV